jgi:hypothetical protein
VPISSKNDYHSTPTPASGIETLERAIAVNRRLAAVEASLARLIEAVIAESDASGSETPPQRINLC